MMMATIEAEIITKIVIIMMTAMIAEMSVVTIIGNL